MGDSTLVITPEGKDIKLDTALLCEGISLVIIQMNIADWTIHTPKT